MATVKKKKQFLLCVRNEGCDDLEVRKLYEQLPDARGTKVDHVRVIDESGQDYLYPAGNFVVVDLPEGARRALRGNGRARKRSAA